MRIHWLYISRITAPFPYHVGSCKGISGDRVQDGLEAVSGEHCNSLDERRYVNGKEEMKLKILWI